jgi:hypothetical protein
MKPFADLSFIENQLTLDFIAYKGADRVAQVRIDAGLGL